MRLSIKGSQILPTSVFNVDVNKSIDSKIKTRVNEKSKLKSRVLVLESKSI